VIVVEVVELDFVIEYGSDGSALKLDSLFREPIDSLDVR
jgi:hypothetical protein